MEQISDIDLRSLRVFATVVRCGGFAAAQPILNIGAPTISEQMSRLESRIGVRLCDRGRAGFRLTEQGEKVYAAAQRLLTSVEDFRQEVSDVGSRLSGELNVGIIDNTITNGDSPLPAALHRFNQLDNDVQIRIDIDSPAVLEQRVLDGRLHAAIGPFQREVPGLRFSPLFREEHQLYCGEKHPFFRADVTSLDELKNARVVARTYMHAADLKVLSVHKPAALIDNVEAQALLILTGEYVGFLPCHYTEPWVEKGRMVALFGSEMRYFSEMALVVKSGGVKSLALEVFLGELFNTPLNQN